MDDGKKNLPLAQAKAIVAAFLNTANRDEDMRFDKAWEIVGNDPELAFARQRLSIHELRHIIRAVAEAFR